MNKVKYNKIKDAFDALTLTKASVDLLASLKVVLSEATEADGMIKIIVERNKQELKIPATILTDYIDTRKSETETEVDTLLAKVDIV